MEMGGRQQRKNSRSRVLTTKGTPRHPEAGGSGEIGAGTRGEGIYVYTGGHGNGGQTAEKEQPQ